MLDGDRLGDHAAHRRAHHVGRFETEVVEQADRVGGHVGQRVGHRREGLIGERSNHHRPEVDLDRVELGRQAAVTVVEADHVVTAPDERFAQSVRPGGQLCGEPHHQQQRHAVG
jgi:hypothetical protein